MFHAERRSGAPGIEMCCTCSYVLHMVTMIQLRHVPDDLHSKLKARAAEAGMSLSAYLLRELRQVAERPTIEELRARLANRAPAHPKLSPARAVRAERGGW
jgi:plasmid stability protein